MSTSLQLSYMRWATMVLLCAGPVVSVHAAHSLADYAVPLGGTMPYLIAAVIIAWSPAPISVPAVLMSDYRDSFRAGDYGIRRSVALYPYLLSRDSGARSLTVAHLVGSIAGVCIIFT